MKRKFSKKGIMLSGMLTAATLASTLIFTVVLARGTDEMIPAQVISNSILAAQAADIMMIQYPADNISRTDGLPVALIDRSGKLLKFPDSFGVSFSLEKGVYCYNGVPIAVAACAISDGWEWTEQLYMDTSPAAVSNGIFLRIILDDPYGDSLSQIANGQVSIQIGTEQDSLDRLESNPPSQFASDQEHKNYNSAIMKLQARLNDK